jgi:hypothetical protein
VIVPTQQRRRRLKDGLTPEAIRRAGHAQALQANSAAATSVYTRHPDDDPATGDVLCCRALHPASDREIRFRGRMHGQAFGINLPVGYVARFTRVLKPGEERELDRLALACRSPDCRAITEYEIQLRPDLLEALGFGE